MGTGAFARPAKHGEMEVGADFMANKSNYAGWGLALGAVLGAVFGVLAGHVGAWLAIGVAIGMMLGATYRRKETDCPQCAEIHQSHEAKTRNENQRAAAGS